MRKDQQDRAWLGCAWLARQWRAAATGFETAGEALFMHVGQQLRSLDLRCWQYMGLGNRGHHWWGLHASTMRI